MPNRLVTMKTFLSSAVLFLVTLTCVAATTGILRVHIKDAINIRDRTYRDKTNNYVQVIAFDTEGRNVTEHTKTARGSLKHDAKWDEELDFGEGDWDKYELRVHSNEQILSSSGPRFIHIEPGCHKPSLTWGWGGQLNYYYNFTLKYLEGRLKILVIDGNRLPDKDSTFILPKNRGSDAYVRVKAHSLDGKSITKRTETRWNTKRPRWNQMLDFGTGTWKNFNIQVFDKDKYDTDDILSKERRYPLQYVTSEGKTERVKCYSNGYINIVYFVEPTVEQDSCQ